MRIGPFGIWEIIIIAVVSILIFGSKGLPKVAKSIGQSLKEFRKGVKDMIDEFEEAKDDKPVKEVSNKEDVELRL